MTTLYREFRLNSANEAGAMLAFVRSNAKPFAEKGTPLRVIVTEEEHDRVDEQIAYYFGVVVKTIAEQAWIGGRQYSKDEWHEELAKRFLPSKELTLPSGEIVIKRGSVARGHISFKKMTKFIQEVEAFAASELGVIFE
jgi:hypothetical protein